MYSETTRSVLISVETEYLPEHSLPGQGRYFWAYHITIENQGGDTVKLLNRYWRIFDGTGQMQEVRGPGVVGEQPQLAPGERFTYTSGVPLAVPGGVMSGHYEMLSANGDMFNAIVPPFSLDYPQQPAQFH